MGERAKMIDVINLIHWPDTWRTIHQCMGYAHPIHAHLNKTPVNRCSGRTILLVRNTEVSTHILGAWVALLGSYPQVYAINKWAAAKAVNNLIVPYPLTPCRSRHLCVLLFYTNTVVHRVITSLIPRIVHRLLYKTMLSTGCSQAKGSLANCRPVLT